MRILGSSFASAVLVAVLLAVSLLSRGDLTREGWWVVVAAAAAAAFVGGVGAGAVNYSARHRDGRLARLIARVRSEQDD